MEKKRRKILKNLQDILDVQGTDGNWNYDPYMFGLFNGLVLAQSLITGEDPKFREAPSKWLGKPKEERAAEKLRKKNPELKKVYEEYKIIEGLLMGTNNGSNTRH